jgi:hypothetical protein
MKKIIVYLLFVIAASVACQKQPTADFSTDTTVYSAGDTIKLKNTSLDAYKYKWTMPDGQTSNATNVNYSTPESLGDGTLTFTLEALSKNGKKTDQATKAVQIKASTGQLTVWSSDTYSDTITVSIDDIQEGYITKTYPTTIPDCGADGCFEMTLKIGYHAISATRGGVKWSGYINITKNKCSKFELKPVSLI